MNKYTELSDFEINKRIAEMDTKNKYVYFEKEQTIFMEFNNGQTQKFNPCNYPSDAMPIIIENGISLISDWNEIGLWGATYEPWIYSENKNPLRAGMEVFLMTRSAENE